MKTKEELNALKEEVEALNEKLAELSEDELKQVVGGLDIIAPTTFCGNDRPSVGGVANEDRLNFLDKLQENPDGRIIYVK